MGHVSIEGEELLVVVLGCVFDLVGGIVSVLEAPWFGCVGSTCWHSRLVFIGRLWMISGSRVVGRLGVIRGLWVVGRLVVVRRARVVRGAVMADSRSAAETDAYV